MNFRKPANPPADTQDIFDRDGQPLTTPANTGKTAAVIDMLALGAGALLLLSAGKSRSMVGGLLKGSAAAALLGRAAKNSGTLGKLAGTLSAGRGFRR